MSNWIDVKSRELPEESDNEIGYSVDVLVYADGVVHQAAVEFVTEEWIDRDGDQVYFVTHWQPLPAPPEG